MNRLRDIWLEIRIELALRRFIRAQQSKTDAYTAMHRYYELCNRRKNSQVKRMEERFM